MNAPSKIGGDYLCDLLDVVMPWPGGLLVALRVYVDASAREGGTFCVAALAFGEARTKRVTRRWADLWGETRCHMTDLHARQGAFKGWTSAQTSSRLVDSVKIINGHLSFGVAVSCDVAEIERLAPKSADPRSEIFRTVFGHAYPLCCHMAMHFLSSMAPDGQDIAYVFERGDLHQGSSQRFIEMMASNVIARASYKYRSHTVLKKEDARIFEMVDILAWEWAKQIERVREGKNMRGSLKALLDVQSGFADDFGFASDTRRATHLHGEPLERFFGRHNEVGLYSDNPTQEQLRALEEWYAKAEATLASGPVQ